MKKNTEPRRLVAFSTETTKAELDTTIAGLDRLEGRTRTSIRSLGCRANGYDRWEVRVFFPYSEALAGQDGATICLNAM